MVAFFLIRMVLILLRYSNSFTVFLEIAYLKDFQENDLGGTKNTRPLSVQFLSFSCSFRQTSCQIIGFEGLAVTLRLGNPGFSTALFELFDKVPVSWIWSEQSQFLHRNQ